MGNRDGGLHPCSMGSERGQATIIGLAILSLAMATIGVLAIFGSILLQQTQLDAVANASAAAAGQPGDDPSARAQAVARDNGVSDSAVIELDDGTRAVRLRARPAVLGRLGIDRDLEAIAAMPEPVSAGIVAGAAVGEAYSGPLERVDSASACPSVASDYRSMQQAAAAGGISLHAVSGYRSVAEQAVLYARLGPAIAAPPGQSLHHAATELDITVGPMGSPTHRWLTANGPAFGFIQRYSWEPWHWGNVRGC